MHCIPLKSTCEFCFFCPSFCWHMTMRVCNTTATTTVGGWVCWNLLAEPAKQLYKFHSEFLGKRESSALPAVTLSAHSHRVGSQPHRALFPSSFSSFCQSERGQRGSYPGSDLWKLRKYRWHARHTREEKGKARNGENVIASRDSVRFQTLERRENFLYPWSLLELRRYYGWTKVSGGQKIYNRRFTRYRIGNLHAGEDEN